MGLALVDYLENTLNEAVITATPISGGDISQVYKIITSSDRFFCKYHSGPSGFLMLKSEKEGLEAISSTRTIRAPEVFHLGSLNNGGVLLMEYVDAKSPSDKDMECLGRNLAALHEVNSRAFGWNSDNYIGSLYQKNTPNTDWPTFYVKNRLLPQLVLAKDLGRLSKKEVPVGAFLLKGIKEYCNADSPSLIHGDLWGGNYLIDKDGVPFLVDPSISYADPGMDLAMSKLFGGFSSPFYESYAETSPLPSQEVIELYQLYYLLVHLNIFGTSYAPAVRSTLRRYF